MQPAFTCSRCIRALTRAAKQKTYGIREHYPPNERSFSVINRPRPPRLLQSARDRTARRNQTSVGLEGHLSQYDYVDLRPKPADDPPSSTLSGNTLLDPDSLFHPLSKSPSSDMRKRGAFIRSHAYCPHPSHHRTRLPYSPSDPETRKSPEKATKAPAFVNFECPDCGIPVSCSEAHWADDYEMHLEVCQTLREINEDDHDLRSGRFFPEFEYPLPVMEEQVPNLSNWDVYRYTRDFKAIDEERPLRQVTKLLSYPLTVASIVHELSPYNIRTGGRITVEGLKSLTALRYNLHPPRTGASDGIKGLRLNPPPLRIFVVGARAESSLPRDVWLQMAYLFPRTTFHLIFIGPESMANRDAEFPLPERSPANPFGSIVEDRLSHYMKISTYVEYFHTLHEARHFYPYDPYFDCFVLFHPGLGHPASSHEWAETIPQLLETKCPIICTGYSDFDMERDRQWVQDTVGGEMDLLMEPGENIFRSLRWDMNDFDPADVTCANWGVWAFRGKRYEARTKEV